MKIFYYLACIISLIGMVFSLRSIIISINSEIWNWPNSIFALAFALFLTTLIRYNYRRIILILSCAIISLGTIAEISFYWGGISTIDGSERLSIIEFFQIFFVDLIIAFIFFLVAAFSDHLFTGSREHGVG